MTNKDILKIMEHVRSYNKLYAEVNLSIRFIFALETDGETAKIRLGDNVVWDYDEFEIFDIEYVIDMYITDLVASMAALKDEIESNRNEDE